MSNVRVEIPEQLFESLLLYSCQHRNDHELMEELFQILGERNGRRLATQAKKDMFEKFGHY